MIGLKVGHYRVTEKIGAGGMGEVYRAHDEQLDRDVALKILPTGALADDAARKRFRKEALTLAKLSHPNIGVVYEFLTQDAVDYLVMECIPGQPLSERLASGALPERETLRLAEQIASALEEAHERGIVHRDLKPSNILITPKGHAKVLDFGLARLLKPVGDAAATESLESLTETQPVAGTLPYMAPEQLRGAPADVRSDFFAFGDVLYEMTTGRRAFSEKLSTQLVDAILHRAPSPPRSVNSAISAELERIILKCLEKEPEHRYQSAKDLVVDLHRLAAPSTVLQPSPLRTRRPMFVPGLAALSVIALAGLFIGLNLGGWRARLFGGGHSKIESLAVLPLKNLSRDPAQDYFAGGMTEQLTTELAQLGSLRVISQTTAMRYRGVDKPLPVIAQELNTDAVLTGAVLLSGKRVRITAQLIQARNDQNLWARSYDGDLSDVLGLQSEVAHAIAQEVQMRVSPQAEKPAASAHKVKPEAYQAYLKGIYGTTTGPMGMGLSDFRDAIKLDPDYAPPYAALARAEYFQGLFGSMSPGQAFAEMKDLAAKALERDASLADAYGWRALVETHYDWKWAEARKDFQRALALNPNQADIHHDYAHFLLAMNLPEDSLAESRRAEELDPFNPMLVACVGWHSLFARQFDAGREHALKALKLEAENPWAYLVLGWSYEQKGMYPEAIEAFRKAESTSMGFPIATSSLAHALAVSGNKAEAQKELDDMLQASKMGFFPAYDIAVVYAGLGNTTQAFQWLEKACEERSAFLIHVKWDPRLDSLHSDPRFAMILHVMDLPT
jgi:serine/threonine protein kinase/Tfp pilus assembly protein PilF